jgi:hypothetical protein
MSNDQQGISAKLRFMDPQTLRQYGEMHKTNPYIFPLVFQESQNRQRLETNQQMQMAGQQQPKVNEQALAQMAPQQLPEDQGIATLAAPNMQQMADGGIAGYDDADFVSRSEPVVMMAGGGVARYNGAQGSAVSLNAIESKYQKELQEVNTGARVQYSPDVQEYVNLRAQTSPDSTPVQVNPIPNAPPQASARPPLGSGLSSLLYSNITPKERARFDKLQAEKQATALKTPFEQERTANMAEIAKGSTYTPEAYSVTKPAPLFADAQRSQALVPSADKTLKDDTERKDTGRKDTKRKDERKDPSAKLPGISDLTTLRQQILDKQDYKDPAASGLLELEATERANAAAERQAVVSDAEKFKDAYKGREGRLAEREADIGKQRTQNTGLALLNAGLAIMSTPGGLATAIGKGAQVGTAQFAAGLDKIRSAQERLGDARDRLEDMKLNREENTAKEIRAAERNYRDVAVNAQKRTIDGIRMAADVNEKRATDIYSKTVDMAKTMYEQGEANKRSAAGNRNNQLEMLQALQADPKLMATYRTMQGKNEDVMGQYNDFLKANPALAMDPKAAFTQFLMTKSAFAQLGASPVTEKAAGPVRKQP